MKHVHSKKLFALALTALLCMTVLPFAAFAAQRGLSCDRNGTVYDYVIGYCYSGYQGGVNTREIFTQPDNNTVYKCPVCGQGGGSIGTHLAENQYLSCYQYDVSATGGDTWIRYALVRHRHNNGTLSDTKIYIPINVAMYSGCYYSYDTTSPVGVQASAPDGWQKNSVTVRFSGGTDSGTSLPDWTATPGDYGSGISHYEYRIDGGEWSGCPVDDPTVTITKGGETTVEARGVDGAGNASADTAVVKIYIDDVAPNAPTVTPSATAWTNQNVSVTAKDNGDTYSGVNRIEISADGGSWAKYSAPLMLSAHGTHTVSARAVDNVGHVSAAQSKTVRIDKVVPVITKVQQTPNTGYTEMTLAVLATDADSGVKGYAVTSVNTAPVASAFSVTPPKVSKNGTYYGWALDNAGNISAGKEITVTALDIVPPVVTKVETQHTWDATQNWAKITATDDNSGVVKIGWAAPETGAITWVSENAAATFNYTNNATYYAFAQDLAGNVSAPVAFTIDRIDKNRPVIDAVNWDKNWTQSKTITVSAHDTESGLGQYAMTQTKAKPSKWQDGNVFTDITQNGTYYLWAKDNVQRISGDPDAADNNPEDDAPVKIIINTIDRSKPVMDHILHSSADNAPEGMFERPYFNVVDRPTMTAHDVADDGWKDSGIKEIQYCFVEDTAENEPQLQWQLYSEANKPAMRAEFTGKIIGRAVDNAGNISDPLDAAFLFEQTPPTATQLLTPDFWTKETVKIALDTTDNLSGVRDITLPNDKVVTGDTAEFAVDKNGTFEFVITDNAGNSFTLAAKVKNIDVGKPVVDWHFVPIDENGREPIMKYGETEYYNYNVAMSAAASEDASGIAKYEYKVNGGAWTQFDAAKHPTFTQEQISTVHVRVWDVAGNVSEEKVRDFVLDHTAPKASHTLIPEKETDGKITIKVSADSSISGTESLVLPDGSVHYGVDGGEWEVSKNGEYDFFFTDRCGNKTRYTVSVRNIVAPSVPQKPSNPSVSEPETNGPQVQPLPVPQTHDAPLKRLTLLDLVCTVLCAVLAVLVWSKRKDELETEEDAAEKLIKEDADTDAEEDARVRRFAIKKVFAVLAAVAAIILFFLTQPLVWRFRILDWWTILYALLTGISVALFVCVQRECADEQKQYEEYEEYEEICGEDEPLPRT